MKRFWDKVDRTAECWCWTASRYHDGYGQFRYEGRPQRAHRVAYTLTIGPIPHGLVLDHLCRNRACVNPDHLEPVTEKVNINRGTSSTANSLRGAFTTQCKSGHPYDEANTYRRSDGTRDCRTCRREAGRRHEQRKRDARASAKPTDLPAEGAAA